ncbi:MAG: DUF1256 domain-containing protein [Christensenellales bacterium]
MLKFDLFDLNDFESFENLFFEQTKNCEIVLLCVGTKKCAFDDFGVIVGDKLKNLKIYCYGSSKREINGTNFLEVFDFVKKKHSKAKIVVIDSVFVKSAKKPILIFQNYGVVVSGLNNNRPIGDQGILFNSFSYHNSETFEKVLNLIYKMFKKIVKI